MRGGSKATFGSVMNWPRLGFLKAASGSGFLKKLKWQTLFCRHLKLSKKLSEKLSISRLLKLY